MQKFKQLRPESMIKVKVKEINENDVLEDLSWPKVVTAAQCHSRAAKRGPESSSCAL